MSSLLRSRAPPAYSRQRETDKLPLKPIPPKRSQHRFQVAVSQDLAGVFVAFFFPADELAFLYPLFHYYGISIYRYPRPR